MQITIREGHLRADSLKIAIVVGRFNAFITDRLLDGALDALKRHGAKDENIEIYKVPGCFEIPALIKRLAESQKYDALITLGALIRGGTVHFDLIAAESIKGIAQVALQNNVAVSYGIITTDNLEQAIDRAGAKAGNKGAEAALAAVETAMLYKEL